MKQNKFIVVEQQIFSYVYDIWFMRVHGRFFICVLSMMIGEFNFVNRGCLAGSDSRKHLCLCLVQTVRLNLTGCKFISFFNNVPLRSIVHNLISRFCKCLSGWFQWGLWGHFFPMTRTEPKVLLYIFSKDFIN